MTHEFDPATFNELGETQLGVDRIATSPTAFALYNNLIAALQGAEGAPRVHTPALMDEVVTNAKLAAEAVTRPKISTATGSSSGTAGSSQGQADDINMHPYSFFPSIHDDGGLGVLIVTGLTSGPQNPDNPGFNAMGLDGTTGYDVRWRYIQASPPYDFGDGEVAGFVYLRLKEGEVGQVWIAPDPPWDGLPDQDPLQPGDVARLLDGGLTLHEAASLVRERRAAPRTKLSGMERRPHPFRPGSQVILVDPMSEEVADLIALNDAGAPPRELFRMFAERYLELDNEPLSRKGPPGVPVHRARMRSTKRRTTPKANGSHSTTSDGD